MEFDGGIFVHGAEKSISQEKRHTQWSWLHLLLYTILGNKLFQILGFLNLAMLPDLMYLKFEYTCEGFQLSTLSPKFTLAATMGLKHEPWWQSTADRLTCLVVAGVTWPTSAGVEASCCKRLLTAACGVAVAGVNGVASAAKYETEEGGRRGRMGLSVCITVLWLVPPHDRQTTSSGHWLARWLTWKHRKHAFCL